MRYQPLTSIPVRQNLTIPYRCPIPGRARIRCPTRRRMMSRLNCRIAGADLRGYAPALCVPVNSRKIVTAFSTLNVLPAAQLANLNELGYLTMTPVQAAALPAILAGKDVRVQAKTGSGKTAAFGLGLLQHVDATLFQTQSLVCARPANWPIRSRVSCVVWRAFYRILKF
jgi:hypothetical protein